MADDLLSEEDDVFVTDNSGTAVREADPSDTSSISTVIIDTDSDMENPSICLKKLLSKRIRGLQSTFSQQSSKIQPPPKVFLQRMETILPRMLEEISKMPLEIIVTHPDSSPQRFHIDTPDHPSGSKRKKNLDELNASMKANIPKYRLHLHVMQLWILALQRTFRDVDGMQGMKAAEREINDLCGLVVHVDKFLTAQSESQVPFKRLGHFEWVQEGSDVVVVVEPNSSSSTKSKGKVRAEVSETPVLNPAARKKVFGPVDTAPVAGILTPVKSGIRKKVPGDATPVAVDITQPKPVTDLNTSDDFRPVKTPRTPRRLPSSSSDDQSPEDVMIVLPDAGGSRGVKRKERSVERFPVKQYFSPRMTRSKSMVVPAAQQSNRRNTRSGNKWTVRAKAAAEPATSGSDEESSAESSQADSESEEDEEKVEKSRPKRRGGFIGKGSLRQRPRKRSTFGE